MASPDENDADAFGQFGVPVHVIGKNAKEQIRISLNEYKGVEYIDVRSFFLIGDAYRPTRRGVTIPTRFYGELLKGVLELGGILGLVDQKLLSELEGLE